ncbi:MAG TPA: LysR family transcriptional regulator [Syntrophomonadaceae bacterium]|nr:LysR family transcriptional regulator [Syntrophomonadaceae bacterium]HPR93825.1 LysR family transcriptional regulator [Syntrophomonadaceae bacterium]
MELRQLKIFVTVAEEKSFTRAAQIMGYAQSNITAQVRSLEEEFDTRLFERLGKKIALTPDGEKLLHHARNMLREASEVHEIMACSTDPSGILNIGIAESLCIFKLPALLKEYSRLYPKVQLVIRQGTPLDFARWLRENTIDVAFSLDEFINDDDLITKVLCKEPMIIVGSNEHHLISKGYMELTDIAQESFIYTERNCSYRSVIEKYLAESKIKPGSSNEFDSIEAIKQFVLSGLGIALLPYAAVEKELSAGNMVDLKLSEPEIEMYTQLIYHKNKWLSPTLLSLLDLVNEYF